MNKFRNTIYLLGLFSILSLLFSCSKSNTVIREKNDFNNNWKFVLDDSNIYKNEIFDDHSWRELNLPHDWSIEGRYSKEHPAGVGGGALPGGTAWYRKSFQLPYSDSTKRIYITFDGVYHNSEVFINGHPLGKRPNGYIGFQYDLTNYLHFGEKKNIIAVRVNNSDQPNSRWYSGSGIYRNVWLEKTNPIHIDLWGTHIATSDVSSQSANISVEVTIKNTTHTTHQLTIKTNILDAQNKSVASETKDISTHSAETTQLTQNIHLKQPHLWSINNPYLYKAVTQIYINDEIIDSYETSFGIRFFEFDIEKGFSLNGESMKILGVCNHHDLGALGAAINTRAIERQLEILKEMGCNAIRTSHNPPAPELLDLCDKMGFIVQNETFDMWAKKKVEYDYSTVWDEWHIRDLEDHLLRDRNHPSIMMWSIGNEILEQWDTAGIRIAKELTEIVKEYAPDIPVTSGLNFPEPENFIYKSGALDLVGYNYHHESFDSFPIKFPHEKFIATETTSSLNTRGSYDMPSDSIKNWPIRWDLPFYKGNADNSCSSYDNCKAPWGSTHRDSWRLVKNNDFLSGMFVWTGFDYLGEPTPYGWPSRSSYFGIVDLAGFPKDAYYMYQSEWTNEPVLHLFPHWNWEAGQEIDVWAYTNFEEVELFVNGVSKGKKSKKGDELHLMWRLNFEPGNIKAIGKNSDGTEKIVEIHTAGEAAKIRMTADRNTIKSDGKDLSFITIDVIDKEGNLVPDADHLIQFETGDLISIKAVDNGSQTSHESFVAEHRKAFNGKCLLVVQSKQKQGETWVKATSKGLESSEIKIELK